MKKHLSFVLMAVLFTSTFTLSAQAQNPRALDQLFPGYQPSILSSAKEVDQIFNQMPLVFRPKTWLSNGSQCFHRAQVWTYDFYRNRSINAMKVFVFYTHAYKTAYKAMYGKPFAWWFHVAPYLLVRDAATQELTEYVVDPTFAETPLKMGPWGVLFVETKKACKEFVPYEKFRREVENTSDQIEGKEHCYLVRVPAVDFDPREVEAREAGEKTGYTWDLNNVSIAVKQAVKASQQEEISSRLGI